LRQNVFVAERKVPAFNPTRVESVYEGNAFRSNQEGIPFTEGGERHSGLVVSTGKSAVGARATHGPAHGVIFDEMRCDASIHRFPCSQLLRL
jgi:hypothetical protein